MAALKDIYPNHEWNSLKTWTSWRTRSDGTISSVSKSQRHLYHLQLSMMLIQ
jgi:hypothetical protein